MFCGLQYSYSYNLKHFPQMDAVYPESFFRQHRRAVRKKVHRGPASRYRTQPVTFAEIQEVDEENAEEQTIEGNNAKSERDLHARFQEFWRRNKHEDIPSPACLLPSPENIYSVTTPSTPPPSSSPPPTLQVPLLSSPHSSLTETSSKTLSTQTNNLSTPVHMIAERSSPSRTSI